VNLGNVVEKRRDRTAIGISAGVFWQTERTWMLFLPILTYREKAGEDTMRVSVWNFWCGYFREEEETDPMGSIWKLFWRRHTLTVH